MAETASVFVSMEFAAYLASTEVGRGLYLDTADEHELYRAFREAQFKHMGDEPAGLVLSFKKDDDGYEGLALLAYMAENDQEMCDDSEHGDSYRQACKEMAPGLDTAQEMLAKFLNDQES
jgi:hypothetical protein